LLSQSRPRDYPSLPSAVDASLQSFTTCEGIRTAYYADTRGEDQDHPLLLIHSINASASAYEVKPLFEYYQGKRPIYALELPGFGKSEREKRVYSPQLYADTIVDLLENTIQRPTDVLALSLSSEFAAIAALKRPELFKSLTLVSPTGLSKVDVAAVIPGETIHKFISLPIITQGLFDVLTRRATIRYYLNQSFMGDAPEDFINYAYITAHQPTARHAPLYFLSGQLFSGGVCENVYTKLNVPVLMLYDNDPNVSFERLPDLLKRNPKWQAERIAPSMGLPHWELLQATTAVLDEFLASHR